MEREREDSSPSRAGDVGDRSMAETLDLLSGLFPPTDPQAGNSTAGGGGSSGVGGASTGQPGELDRNSSRGSSTSLPWDEASPFFTGPDIQRQNPGYEVGHNQQQQQQPLDLLTGGLGFTPPSQSPSAFPGPAVPTSQLEKSPAPDTAAHSAWASSSGNGGIGYGGFFQEGSMVDDARLSPGYSPPRAVQSGSDRGASFPPPGQGSGSLISFFEEVPSAAGDIISNADLPSTSEHENASVQGASPTSSSHAHEDPVPPFESSVTSSGVSDFQFPKLNAVSKLSVPSGQHSASISKHDPKLHQVSKSGTGSAYRSDLHHADSCPPRLPPTLNTSSYVQIPNEGIQRSLSDSTYDDRVPSMASDPVILSPGEEFHGRSARGMYKAPVRGAVIPGRPVSLDLRPHPLRGPAANQVSLLVSLEGSLWAACDQGLMLWINVERDSMETTGRNSNLEGDEDATPYEFIDVKLACMMADVAHEVVWTGQQDGTINAWDWRKRGNDFKNSRVPRLSFAGHRSGVTALGVTSYGDLWAGSERGDVRVWSKANITEALARRGNGSSLMEELCRDLINGTSFSASISPLTPEVRLIVEDYAHGMVWCAGAQYIGIWDARTRELVRLFLGSSGVDLSMVDVGLSGKEALPDNDAKLGYSKYSFKKEKSGWLQRSRNAVMGAADAVRRVASGGNDESKILKALVAAADGTMWGGYGNGALVHWDWNGYKQWELTMPSIVKSLCAVGNRLWVGYADGRLEVIDMESRKPMESWQAHRLEVSQAVVCRGYVFSMGLNGSIRGWDISYPNRLLDTIVAQTMRETEESFTRHQNVQILATSWNTAEETCSIESARSWLAPAASADIVVVGLQEVEVGAGVLGMAAVKESVKMGLEKGSEAAQGWLKLLDTALLERRDFKQVASRQLAGMLVGVWVEKALLPSVGDIEVGAVACGFGRTFGNKGAVGVRFLLFRRTVCLLTSHLAAHMDQVPRRNADFEHIYSSLSFNRVSVSSAGSSFSMQGMLRGAGSHSRRYPSSSNPYYMDRDSQPSLEAESSLNSTEVPELATADLLVWAGDMNYRIDNLPYDEIISLINGKQWAALLSKDQLRDEMQNGRTFMGLREGPLKFPPSYKFDKWTDDYDSSEKKRLPAWCDRVLFRDSFGGNADRSGTCKQTLERPCRASVVLYESCMTPKDSDHKPVRCMLSVDLAVIDESKRRRAYGLIRDTDPRVQTCMEESNYVPVTSLSTNKLVLEGNAVALLRLNNGDKQDRAWYEVHCNRLLDGADRCPCGDHETTNSSNGKEHQQESGLGFPRWLQVRPASGVVEAGDSASIRVKAMTLSNSDEPQENVVVLHVIVKGTLSTSYKRHQICVSHGPAIQTRGLERGISKSPLHEHARHSPSLEKFYQVSPSMSEKSSRGFTQDSRDLLF